MRGSREASWLAGLALAILGGCSTPPPGLQVFVSPELHAPLQRFVETIPSQELHLAQSADPQDASHKASGFRAALIADLDCGECYRLERQGDRVEVHGGGLLGVQYGLAHLLEEVGVRFFHPWKTRLPSKLALPPESEAFGVLHEPQMKIRGLHPHTLHPIEAYFDLWEPGEKNLQGAVRLIDWIVKNRGNYLQYPALDNIQSDPAAAQAWRAHTRAILQEAHSRGVRVGIAVQLFGKSNLQLAFDLLEGDEADPRAAMQERLKVVLEDLPFDAVTLAFGEFFNADPALFVERSNQVMAAIQELAPGIQVNASVHVGDQESLRVTYQGERLLYYFLIKFADARYVPYVHTVMYYNLFEDAGGAYHHQDFFEHRDLLLDRLRRGLPVAYHPESAYWVAFDISVPTYLPLYIRSRWLDLAEISRVSRAEGLPGLQEHTLFSSGWEWGYWQNDYATLRMNYSLPERWEEPLEQMYAPWGLAGARLAEQLRTLGELQHQALITHRLAPYLAGRDQVIDGGKVLGILAQPDRPSFDEVRSLSASGKEAFRRDVLSPLQTLAEGTTEVLASIDDLPVGPEDPWFSEVRDGVEVTLARTRFIHDLYEAALAPTQEQATGWLGRADMTLASARAAVLHRHANLHDPDGRQLLRDGPNATFYKYGYLREAHTLCYWVRERTQVRRLVLGVTESEPACVL